ncbi:MAG TPA: SGNH/GDSL hydrolase family protein [Capsulimonadaceae bacterium]
MATPTPDQLARSVVATGNTSRIQRVLAKARLGSPVTIVFLGGSITQGAAATLQANRYASLVATWWKQKYPTCALTFINAGIGATGSNYGSFRAQRDVFASKPDLVVVEYACNDGNTPTHEASYEGLLRQILTQPQDPAVLLLFMMHEGGTNDQASESKIGKYYDLPMISYRDALWPDIQAGTIKYADYQADQVHPRDLGHAYAANLLTSFLSTCETSSAVAKTSSALPPALVSTLYEHTHLYEAKDIVPTRADGWELREGKYWFADKPGSILECDVDGQSVTLLGWRIKGPMGRIRAQVDDKAPVTIEGWFAATWGGYMPCELIGSVLTPGMHHVKIELLADKNPESTGYEYRIFGLGTAGALK